jgi:biopolymer transport protein ExbB
VSRRIVERPTVNPFVDAFTAIRSFFEAGGDVLWAIFAVTTLMWTFIIERLWFLNRVFRERVEETLQSWFALTDVSAWQASCIRRQLISEISLEAHRFLLLIKTLMAVLPLLGLLGTVTGMIQVFDVMAMTGTGNARLMAAGVSAATIPTMSGLVAALSGLYLATYLEQRADREVKRAEDMLVH